MNQDAWREGKGASSARRRKGRGRSAAGGSACSGQSRSSGSPSTCTTGRSRRTSRRGTTSPSDVPRSSRWVSCAPASSSSARELDERRVTRAREARRIDYVKPGERLFVVKGIPAWRKARSATAPARRLSGMDDRTIVAGQLGRAPRAFRSVVVRCPYGLPAVTEQLPYDAEACRSRRRTTSRAHTS